MTKISKKRERIFARVLVLSICLLAIIAFLFASNNASATIQEQGELSLRNAILRSAKQCASIEGSYPASLNYLEENYGLVIQHDKFAVSYEVFAENVMPSVVVLAR